MFEPLVSVIITTYNRPDFIEKAIQSVLDQTYKNWELIIVNDAGENIESWIANNYYDLYRSKQLSYIHKEKNAGLGAARNTGLEYVNGKYVNFLDDDDRMYPHHVETLVRFAEKDNKKIVYGDAVYEISQKENGQYVVKNKVIVYSFNYQEDMLLYQNITPVNCVMFALDDLTRNVKFDENARAYEDWLYWLDLTKIYPMHHIAVPICVVTTRNDGSTMSSSRNEFTTMLPEIYTKTIERAKDKVQVATIMNSILQQRGLQPLFRIVQQ